MWAHAATQTNATRLRDDFGYALVAPESGALASGSTGVGRLAETSAIIDAVVAAIGAAPIREPNESRRPPAVPAGDLSGRRIVVTAGGTEEPIDAVRILANRSSGRQGIALAEAARDRGADVGEDVAEQISDGEKQHTRAKHHGAQPGQFNLSRFAGSNQVGAQQHANKGHHDEVVVLVSAGWLGMGHGRLH